MMRPRILPIQHTSIDWGQYIQGVLDITGRSPTRMLDLQGVDVGSASSFIQSLEFFSNTTGDYLLEHTCLTFAIEISKDEYIQILERTTLQCCTNLESQDQIKMVIATGSANDWKSACLEFTNVSEDFPLRYIFDCIYIYLNGMKLLHLKKVNLQDQTFALEDQS